MPQKYDYIVIGSGFGGSVSAMRLAEKGYSVLVLEKGKRWKEKDFPHTDWNLPKYLWMPLLKWFGFQKLTFFKEVFVISGVGVGGGSLVYANTHMLPKENFYTNKLWSHFKDWKTVLAPYFKRAQFMLGSTQYTKDNAEDIVLREVAEEMGHGHSFKSVDGVGVYLGDTQKETDPYFKGLGPLRKGCTECAACMTGCRHGAKNTLDKNYLWFAENMFGAKVEAETLVTKIEYSEGEYWVHTQSSTSLLKTNERVFKSSGLVVAGGVLGTMDLLLKQKYIHKTLPNLSDKLGDNILTNSEMLSGVGGADRKLNNGLSISRVFSPDENTNIEVCKFANGSGAMMHLGTLAVGNGTPAVRTAKLVGQILSKPITFFKLFFTKAPADKGIIFLIMQTLENSMQLKLKRGLFGSRMTMVNESKQPVPTFIPIGQEALYRFAKKVNGIPMNALTEVTMGLASTAHILGGCPMGKTKDDGVVDDYFRAHGYPNMYILDGSIMPCNLGVNPSLTITTFAEYAMDNIPKKSGVEIKSLVQRMADA
ncbi:MAG: GMC family oxidoreductase [Chitinophagales bacterium]|nr:GMC family oxidoreductase [Chitinophagales bacterium]